MIDLYTWSTPNGRKVSIMLEELGIEYAVHSVNISQDEQFTPEFLAISPNNKIPAIVDRDNGLSLMESGSFSCTSLTNTAASCRLQGKRIGAPSSG